MKRINSLSDLLMEELADLLSAENQLIEALPRMAKASQSSVLRITLEDHLEATKDQADRLQDIFSNIGKISQGVNGEAMKRLIEESEDIIKGTEKGPVRDAAIIGVTQRMEHYEITRYVTAREHAEDLGHIRIGQLLDKTLHEERTMKLYLSELAQSMINVQAIDPNASLQQESHRQEYSPGSEGKGFYIPQKKFTRGRIKKKFKGGARKLRQEGNDEKK